jgi:hypothetical protein
MTLPEVLSVCACNAQIRRAVRFAVHVFGNDAGPNGGAVRRLVSGRPLRHAAPLADVILAGNRIVAREAINDEIIAAWFYRERAVASGMARSRCQYLTSGHFTAKGARDPLQREHG